MRLDNELRARLEHFANRSGLSAADLIRRALEERLETWEERGLSIHVLKDGKTAAGLAAAKKVRYGKPRILQSPKKPRQNTS